MSEKKPTLLNWLGLKREIDLAKIKPLGAFLGAAIFLLGVLLVIAFFIVGFGGLAYLISAFIGIGPYSGDPTGAAIRNIGLFVVAVFGAPLLVWRSIVAQKQVDVSEQGQITDRINKAVEGLGTEKTVRKIVEMPIVAKAKPSFAKMPFETNPDGTIKFDREAIEHTTPNLEVRIGAIYALERIAQDSLRDHIQIMEILCAYVRENAPAKSLEPAEDKLELAVPRADIQTAITVIGRRSENRIALEWEKKFRLDLRNCDFSDADFRSGNFSAALLHNCKFEIADFGDCKLMGSQFNYSLIRLCSFHDADLAGARLISTSIIEADRLKPGLNPHYSGHLETAKKLKGINVVGADLSNVITIAPFKDSFGDISTIIGKHRIPKERASGVGETSNAPTRKRRFPNWLEGNAITYHAYVEYLEKLDLKEWPYVE